MNWIVLKGHCNRCFLWKWAPAPSACCVYCYQKQKPAGHLVWIDIGSQNTQTQEHWCSLCKRTLFSWGNSQVHSHEGMYPPWGLILICLENTISDLSKALPKPKVKDEKYLAWEQQQGHPEQSGLDRTEFSFSC